MRRPNLVVPVGIACGLTAASQTRINANLAAHLGSALLAALVSFSVGLLALCFFVLSSQQRRQAVRRLREANLSWFLYLGGLSGAGFVTVAAYTAQQVGVAVFVVTAVTGQTLGSLILDRTRLSPTGIRPITAKRGAAVVLAVIGAAATQLGRGAGDIALLSLTAILLVTALLPVQTALNARLAQAAGNSETAALVNFTVGTTGLALATTLAITVNPIASWHFPAEPWLYLGGLLGALFITGMSWSARHTGMLRLSLLYIGGQLAGGIALDLFTPGSPDVTAFVLAGAAVTLAATALAGEKPRRAGTAPDAVAPRTTT